MLLKSQGAHASLGILLRHRFLAHSSGVGLVLRCTGLWTAPVRVARAEHPAVGGGEHSDRCLQGDSGGSFSSCDPGGRKAVWSMNLAGGPGGDREEASWQAVGRGEQRSVHLQDISRRKSAFTLSVLASGSALFPAGDSAGYEAAESNKVFTLLETPRLTSRRLTVLLHTAPVEGDKIQ